MPIVDSFSVRRGSKNGQPNYEEIYDIGTKWKNISGKPAIIGKDSGTGGEIFNDYENNGAYGQYSHAEGYGTYADGRGAHAEGGREQFPPFSFSGLNTRFTLPSEDGSSFNLVLTNYSDPEQFLPEFIPRFKNVYFSISVQKEKPLLIKEGWGKISYFNEDPDNILIELIDFDFAGVGQTLNEKYIIHVSPHGARGDFSHTEGYGTHVKNENGHAEGYLTCARGYNAHAEGKETIAKGLSSHAEGESTKAIGHRSHAEGYNTYAEGEASHAEGGHTHAIGLHSHAEGSNTTASGNVSHAEGIETTASGAYSHAEGYGTDASGDTSHAEGLHTIASGDNSHAEGQGSTASGEASHAEGFSAMASGLYSHAEGYATTASKGCSHAEGSSTTASGNSSHAEGSSTTASGSDSHAEGFETIASGDASHVQGKYNIDDTANEYAHIVGNGASSDRRSNAHTLDWKGNAWYKGNIKMGGTSYDNANEVALKADIQKITTFDEYSSFVIGEKDGNKVYRCILKCSNNIYKQGINNILFQWAIKNAKIISCNACWNNIWLDGVEYKSASLPRYDESGTLVSFISSIQPLNDYGANISLINKKTIPKNEFLYIEIIYTQY